MWDFLIWKLSENIRCEIPGQKSNLDSGIFGMGDGLGLLTSEGLITLQVVMTKQDEVGDSHKPRICALCNANSSAASWEKEGQSVFLKQFLGIKINKLRRSRKKSQALSWSHGFCSVHGSPLT